MSTTRSSCRWRKPRGPRSTNACLSCHNTEAAWSHATANTNQYGESCAVCHDANSQYSVGRVHAQ